MVKTGITIGIAVFLVFSGLTFLVYDQLAKLKDQEMEKIFDNQVAQVIYTATEHKLEYTNLLYAMQGLFSASVSVEANEFQAFAKTEDFPDNFYPLLGLSYVERVEKGDLNKFIASVRADKSLNKDGNPNFDIYPKKDKVEYHIVRYVEPLDGPIGKSFGADVSEIPGLTDVMGEALSTGGPAISGNFKSPITGLNTFVEYLALYKGTVSPASSEERVNQHIGFATEVFATQQTLDHILSIPNSDKYLDIDVFEGATSSSANMIYDDDNDPSKENYSDPLTRYIPNFLGNKKWIARIYPDSAFTVLVSARISPQVSLGAGFVVAILSALLAYYLLEGKRRAVEIAAGMTADIETKSRNLQKVNRALMTISEANQTAIQATDENKLIQEVCDILVKNAGYRMVWVGFAMDDEQKSVKPIAWAGYTEGYIEKLNASWADTGRGKGPTGIAIREKRTIINPDFSKNPDFKPWYEDATKRGYKGSVVIPLFSGNRVFGVINIYATETGLFNADEVKMLEELAGDLAYSIVSIRNKAEKEKAYVALRKTAEELSQFKLAVDNASDHIIITDPKGVITYANKGMENITGYSRQEVIGKNPRIWGGQMPKEFYIRMWHTLSGEKKPFAGEIRNKRKNGEPYDARSSISPILDDNGNIIYYVGVERDITKEKEVDRSKSEFVSLASHQLRTPLSAINWYSEMLLGGDAGKLTDKQKDYTQEIYGSSKRMSDLVGALLNVSRIEMGTFAIEPKPTNIIEIVDSCVQELEPKIKGKNQLVDRQYASDIPLISIDQNLIRIVLQNLISNAVKYTPDGGKIMVSIRKNGKNLEIKVQDNGYGIPLRQQDKVFSKFFRADNIIPIETDGTGLGLYIVKEVVEKAGGAIRFESEENKGTTFYINLPLSGMQAKEGTRSLN